MRMRVLLVLCAALALTVGATAALSATTVTIGQNLTGTFMCVQAWAVSPGVSAYTVPSGNWNVTSWSTQAGPDGGSMSLLMLRPTATPGSFLVVGVSPVESLTVNILNTFTLATPIAVQGGDLLGFWEDGADCAVGSTNPIVGANGAALPVAGTTIAQAQTGFDDLNISATLTPPLPTTKDECKNGGWKSFGVFKNQGDCVSVVATGGKNPPANG